MLRPGLLLAACMLAGCDDKAPPPDDSTLSDDSVATPDEDGDGYPGAEDCDDTNPAVNPGAAEVCDGVDNNCDGAADEGVTTDWYTDADADGYGAGEPTAACEAPEGATALDGDCDDNNPDFHPGAEESDCADPNDYNCDNSVGYADADGDGFAACEECDDSDAATSPDAAEVCDGVDNNCDGATDEPDAVDASTWYADADADGYGDSDYTAPGCTQPEGYAANALDCDDAESTVNPAAAEVCDGIDNNCDGTTDGPDAADAQTWYADSDSDGHGDPTASSAACTQPAGAVADSTDCDDTDAAVNPDATELCDGLDNNCDGTTDEPSAADAQTWYTDSDSDGHGDPAASAAACTQPEGAVAVSTDCDDTDAAVNPDATELCDGLDNNCDGTTDGPDAADAQTWYTDADADGYGDPADATVACDTPSGTVADDSDCDDTRSSTHPGAAEVWYDGVDQACDGGSDYDQDGDGDDAEAYGGGDCDDTDSTRYTGLNCRPTATCTAPSATTLAANDPSGASDVVFDDNCTAYVSTVVSGTDYIYKITSAGHTATVTGYSNYNIPSVGVTSAGKVVVSHNDNSNNAIGLQGSGTSISNLATGTYTSGSSWSNSFMNQCTSSIAVEGTSAAWVPNFAGTGTLVRVDLSSGSKSTVASLGTRIEGVGFDASGDLFVSYGAGVYQVNTSSGAATLVYAAPATVLDFVFDYNDDLYLETTGNVILLVEPSGSSSTFASVSGDGKLDITPDGRLVRIQVNPSSAASWAEWTLGD